MGRPGDGIRFHAKAETGRTQYGQPRWHCSITGRRLDGTLTVLRHGAAVHEKWMRAGKAKA